MLDSKKSCILESKLSENEIYEVKKELAENEEIEMDSGEINVSPKTINKYISSKVVQTWVNINVNGTDYWTDAKNISCEKGFSPIEQIPYNDWKRYFTEIDVQGIDKYKFKESEEHFKKLKFTDVQFEMFKKKKEEDSRNPVPRYRMAHFIKENAEQTDFYYFKNKTEWIADDKLTEMLCKEYPVFKDKLKKQREKYVFFDEARKLRSPGFPQGDTFWYFHPARFINHIDKVVTPAEFNPYAGREPVTIMKSNFMLQTRTQEFKSNPGFAPYNTDLSVYGYEYNGLNYAYITCLFDVKRSSDIHTGVDFGSWQKSVPIKSFIKGIVLECTWNKTKEENAGTGYGNMMLIEGDNGYLYLLAHLTSYLKEKGDPINPGEDVAMSGTTGNSTSYHLHLEILKPIDEKAKMNTMYSIRKIDNQFIGWSSENQRNNRYNPFDHTDKFGSYSGGN